MLKYSAGQSQSFESAVEGALSLAENDGNAVLLEHRGYSLLIQPGETKDEVMHRWQREAEEVTPPDHAGKEARIVNRAMELRDAEQGEFE